MESNNNYRVVISSPFGLTSPETNENAFTAKLIDLTKDKKGEEYFLMKVTIPFHLNRLIREEIVKDNALLSGKYRVEKEYQDLKVEYIVASYRNKSVMFPSFNISYIANDFVNQFKNIDSIKDKLTFIIIGSIEGFL